MNKRDLVMEIVGRNQVSRVSTALIVDELLSAISRALSDGRPVQLRRFGTFALRSRRARTMRNPRTGEPIHVPAKLVPVFRSSRRFGHSINCRSDES